MSEDSLRWVSSCGGPLILLPERLIEAWSGVDAPLGGRSVETKARWDPAGPATDYDRACDVEEPIAAIDVGDGRGIVIGGEPPATTFVPRPDGGLLVGWADPGAAPSEGTELLRRVEALDLDFAAAGDAVAMVEVRPGPLILFDAACPGIEVEEDRLVLPLHPGEYLVSAGRFDGDEAEGSEPTLVRLQRIGEDSRRPAAPRLPPR